MFEDLHFLDEREISLIVAMIKGLSDQGLPLMCLATFRGSPRQLPELARSSGALRRTGQRHLFAASWR